MNETYEIPYYLTDDDDTEEMEPREYRPCPPKSEWEFPDPDLLPDPPTDLMDKRQIKKVGEQVPDLKYALKSKP